MTLFLFHYLCFNVFLMSMAASAQLSLSNKPLGLWAGPESWVVSAGTVLYAVKGQGAL